MSEPLTDQSSRQKKIHKIVTFVEILLLAGVFLIFPSWSEVKVIEPEDIHFTSYRNVTVAMGLYEKNIYPCFSETFFHFLTSTIRDMPDEIIHVDLRKTLKSEWWPNEQNQPFFYRGMESGMVFLILKVWKVFDFFSLGSIISLLLTFHLLAVLSVFFLLRSLNITGLAFLSALCLAYSPTVLQNVYQFSHYSFPVFSICIALPLVYFGLFENRAFLKNSILKYSMLFSGGMVIAGFAVVRSTSAFMLFPIGLLLLLRPILLKSWREGKILLVVLGGFFLMSIVINHMIWTPERLAFQKNRYHNFWQSVWVGLGQFENPHGYKWSDYESLKFAVSKDPDVIFNSAEFETILRTHVISTLKTDPLFFVSTYVKKLNHFTYIWMEFLPWPKLDRTWISVFFFWFGFLGTLFWIFIDRNKRERLVWIFFPTCFYLCIPIMISSEHYIYNNSAYLATSFCFFFVITRGFSWVVERAQHANL